MINKNILPCKCIPYGLLYSKMLPLHFLFGVEFIFFFQFSSVAQLCFTLCHLMNSGLPGFPVLHQLLEFGYLLFGVEFIFYLLISFIPNVIWLLVLCPCFTLILHISTIPTKNYMLLPSFISELSPKVPLLHYLRTLPMFLILPRIPFSISNFQKQTPAPILLMLSPTSNSFQV